MNEKKSKHKGNRDKKEYDVSIGLIEATDSIRSIIHTLNAPLEEKIAMEDHIIKLSDESNSLLDVISSSTTAEKNYQKKLLLAYREFLERNIDAINQRIGKNR